MQLSPQDLRSLPLAAALVERDHEVVAQTPEWAGVGAGCVSYPVRTKRLLVAGGAADERWRQLVGELLARMERLASSSAGDDALRLRMLAASLRLLGSGAAGAEGTAEEAARMAVAGIAARSTLHVQVHECANAPLRSPEAVALILVQLAVNAERHDAARVIGISFDASVFRVRWEPEHEHAGPGNIVTSRRHAERQRWGMGFARIAADALGATVYPPRALAGGGVEASLEVGIGRLTLPLAAVRHEVVSRATRSWDEETGVPPGSHMAASPRLAQAVRAAQRQPGCIVCSEGWSARAVDGLVWVAVPPDDAADRMHDVLDGLAHEHALFAGIGAGEQAHIRALALTLGVCLGRQVPRVPARAWQRRMQALADVLALRCPVPAFEGVGAVDADVSAVLARRTGGTFECEGDCLWLRVDGSARQDVMVRCLAAPGDERIRLA